MPVSVASHVGSLCEGLPQYCYEPPIEAVVLGFGVNEDGQLGLDTADNVLTPKVVEALLGTRFRGRDFGRVPLVAGSRNTLAIDAEGQVMTGNERKPRRVLGLKGVRVVQVAIGGWHALAVDEGGQMWAWGGNEYGQCGVNPWHRDIAVPCQCLPELRVQQCLPELRVQEVGRGVGRWGGFACGQAVVGRGSRSEGGRSGARRQVSAGGMHSLALTEAGEIWQWGEPWGDFSVRIDRGPRRLDCTGDFVAVAAGAFHNLALNAQGEVFSWGINDFGQLGNGTTSYAVTPQQILDLEGVFVSDIAAGGWHSMALSAEGGRPALGVVVAGRVRGAAEVYVWGRGEYGRLGLGDRAGSSKLRPVKVKALEGHRVVGGSCGGTHTAVVTDEGRCFIWGRGAFGRLGTGVEKNCISPVELKLPGGAAGGGFDPALWSPKLPGGPERWHVISVAAGGRHSLCLALPVNEPAEGGPTPARSLARRGNYYLPSPSPSLPSVHRDRSWVAEADDEASMGGGSPAGGPSPQGGISPSASASPLSYLENSLAGGPPPGSDPTPGGPAGEGHPYGVPLPGDPPGQAGGLSPAGADDGAEAGGALAPLRALGSSLGSSPPSGGAPSPPSPRGGPSSPPPGQVGGHHHHLPRIGSPPLGAGGAAGASLAARAQAQQRLSRRGSVLQGAAALQGDSDAEGAEDRERVAQALAAATVALGLRDDAPGTC
ncbi:hypothetical protein N2152v2_006702 [Parachlorella kessleri]